MAAAEMRRVTCAARAMQRLVRDARGLSGRDAMMIMG